MEKVSILSSNLRARKQQMEPAKSSSTIIERISRFSRRGSMFSTDHRPSVAFDSRIDIEEKRFALNCYVESFEISLRQCFVREQYK